MRVRAAFRHFLALALLTAGAATCTTDRAPVAPGEVKPRAEVAAAVNVSGQVLGPGGTTICGSLRFSKRYSVTIVRLSDLMTVAYGDFPCADGFQFALEPGSYQLVVGLSYPTRESLLPTNVVQALEVGSAETVHDVTVLPGTPLQGTVTVDGVPIGGLDLYADLGAYSVLDGQSSAADGTWRFLGGPVILQNGLTYSFPTCSYRTLGTSSVTISPPGPFVFPAEADHYSCAFTGSPAARFTHTATRLALTVGSAGLGYTFTTSSIQATYGLGFGLQYPSAPGAPQYRADATLLRRGGLVVGLPTNALFGNLAVRDMTGNPSNVILDGSGKLDITDLGGGAKQIFWQYDDAGIAGAPGLAIDQKSWDGIAGDYVLLQYRIRNRGDAAIQIAPGFYMAHDIYANSPDPEAYVGRTALGGRLVYGRFNGRHVGTLLLGAPAAPRARFYGARPAWEDVYGLLWSEDAIMADDFTATSRLGYAIGAGSVSLKRGQKTDFSVAVVAGSTLDELLANAAAAEAEYATRQ